MLDRRILRPSRPLRHHCAMRVYCPQLLILTILLVAGTMASSACAHTTRARPDAVRASAAPGYPNGQRPRVDQGRQDAALQAYYAQWKARYVRHGACGADRTYIDSSQDAGEPGSITVSEAHGWGMLIFAAMQHHDPQARGLFDGMVRFAADHPSTLKSGLMAWDVHSPCTTPKVSTSAPDGDLDIALALLAAHRLWGADGALDYQQHALSYIHALKNSEAVVDDGYFRLWEYIAPGEPHAGQTRTSDYMMGHLRAFEQATKDASWQRLREQGYTVLQKIAQANPSGFFPDFIGGLPDAPAPAQRVFRQDGRDGTYSYNACRLPMRWALDYLLHGDRRSQRLAEHLVEAMRVASGDDPARIVDGYDMAGRAVGDKANRLAFVAPVAVGAMASDKHQVFLDRLWAHLVQQPLELDGYYGNTLKLLALIALAGRWPLAA